MREAPAFDVVCHAALDLKIPVDRYEYEGRSHSLWFCDAETAGEHAWYETAFMVSALIPRRGRQNPFALAPGEAAAKALWTGMAEYAADKNTKVIEEIACAENNRDFPQGSTFGDIPISTHPDF